MRNEKYANFIKDLTKKSKLKIVDWEYYEDDYEDIAAIYRNPSSQYYSRGYNPDETYMYFDDVTGTVIIFFTPLDIFMGSHSVIIIPSSGKNIAELEEEDYGSEISILKSVIMSQFPNADDFIDDFINRQ